MNEEHVKNQIILPWLSEAGVELGQLQFETSFNVRLGRQSIRVGDGKATSAARGRLDILVTREDRNLLLIEAKAADQPLEDKDRDQAISYARIVDPIAPYALVTNGKIFHLYETLTKQLIDPSSIRTDTLELSLPGDDLAEAQRLFLRLSRSNLMAFCELVTLQGLQHLKGSIAQQKKYIPELHISRASLGKQVDRFLSSCVSTLILTGPSGVGKSCELCSIAEYLLRTQRPVFFFNGSLLETGILEAIANEFEWQFEADISATNILKRIDRLSNAGGCIVVIDAIDEWIYEKRSVQLANVITALEGRNIKFILSCKDTALDNFTSISGVPTATRSQSQILQIPLFEQREFADALKRYRAAYDIDYVFDHDVLLEARENPFLLRILFDTAKQNESSEFTFESGEIFNKYLMLISQKTTDPAKATRTIDAIARQLYNANADQVTESEIRSALGLSINDDLMSDLFDYGILFRRLDDANVPSIGFYFQQLRDYVIAFRVIRFSTLTDNTFKQTLAETSFPSVRGDALISFYRISPVEQKRWIDQKFRDRASEYLNEYVNTIKNHFPAASSRFDPIGDEKVGFVGELLMPDLRIGHHGFRPISDNDLDVEFAPVSSLDLELGNRGRNRIFRDVSITRIGVQNCSFRDGGVDVVKLFNDQIFPQIEELILEGNLCEKNNPDMLEEYLVGVILDKSDIFKQLYKDGSNTLPDSIALAEINRCMLVERLQYHFETLYIEQVQAEQKTSSQYSGVHLYHHTWTAAGREWVANNVDKSIRNGTEFANGGLRSHVDLTNLNDRVSEAIKNLESHNHTSVNTKFRGCAKSEVIDCKTVDVNIIGKYLTWLHVCYLSNFDAFAKTNLPTLYHLPQFQLKVHSVFMVISPRVADSAGRGDHGLTMYYCETDNVTQVAVVVDETKAIYRANDSTVQIDGKYHDVVSVNYTSIKNYCRRDDGLYDSLFSDMPIRAFVYSTILNGLRELQASDCLSTLIAPVRKSA